MQRPNILYIHSHDTGRYVQPYGYAVPTPNIQRLAEEGVLFRQAFCASPTCSPSRACLLTGQYAHNNGMLGLAHRGFSLNDYSHHLLHTLRRVGYVSALAGVQHIANMFPVPWQAIGYDMYLGDPPSPKAGLDSPDNQAHLAAVDFLTSSPPQPFFLSVGFKETHRQFPPLDEEAVNPDYVQPPAPLPDVPAVREDTARFLLSARSLDAKMGAVFDALERSGLAENTLVICTTDHGLAFPHMKCNLTAHGTGVMLILRGPGGFSGGKVIDALVSQIDIFPTLCDLLEIPQPEWLQGVSLLPLVRGEAAEVRAEVFAEVNFHAAPEPMRSVRTRRWSYIRRFDERSRPVLPNVDDGPSKSFLLEHGWGEIAPPAEALYDLALDPNERHNLTGCPGYEEVAAEMRQRLQRWMEATHDPLLEGPLTPPPGATLNDPDGLSPSHGPYLDTGSGRA